MAFKKTFVVSDESVNTYGFWIRTAGIKMDNAKQNCPAYFNHQTWDIPLGHWENIRVVNGELLADVVIEGANEREKEYIRKIENGDIKGASIGADPLIWNEDFLKEGQTRPTLFECELFEISLAPLPGNKNALALKSKDGLITLSDTTKATLIPDLNTQSDMKQIAQLLGLSENATEAEIQTAIRLMLAQKNNVELMRKHIEQQAAEVLDSEEKKNLFVELSKSDFAQALTFLNLYKKPATEASAETPANAGNGGVKKDVKVSELVQKGKQQLSKAGTVEEGKESFDYLQKHNAVELARIRKEEPDTYAQLASDYKNGVRYTGSK